MLEHHPASAPFQGVTKASGLSRMVFHYITVEERL